MREGREGFAGVNEGREGGACAPVGEQESSGPQPEDGVRGQQLQRFAREEARCGVLGHHDQRSHLLVGLAADPARVAVRGREIDSSRSCI
jgi:hypothetical protein